MDNPTETESEPYQIFYVGFVVDKVALEEVSLRVLRIFLIIFIPAMVHTRLQFIYNLDAVHIILEMASFLKRTFHSLFLYRMEAELAIFPPSKFTP